MHNNGTDGHVSAVEHPKRPRRKPAVALLCGESENFLLEQFAQDGTVIAFVDTGDGDGELQVLELVETDSNSI